MSKTPGSGGEPPRHSLAEIQAAIESIMSRLSGGRSFDASLAQSLAGTLSGAVNDPKNDMGALAGNPAFERMVTEQAPKLAEAVNDPAARLAAAKAEEARSNISGAPLSAAARAELALARFAEGRSDTSGRSGDRSSSSANYDGFASTNWNTPAGIAQMRDYALQHGVGWAANNTEILKLGPAAIDVLARTGLRKDVYTGLTKEAGLSAKGAIGIAAIAEKNGEDANVTGQAVKESLQEINNPAVTKAVDHAAGLQIDPKATPKQKQEAGEALDRRLDEVEKKDPSKAGAVKTLREKIKVKAKENDAQAAATTAKKSQEDELLASLGESKPPAPPAQLPKPDSQTTATNGRKGPQTGKINSAKP